MNDVQQQDRKLFTQEMLRPGRLFLTLVPLFVLWLIRQPFLDEFGLFGFTLVAGLILLASLWTAFTASVKRRFINKRYEALWIGCKDRLERFDDVLTKMRREQVADLHDMPRTIRRVGESLYYALRRADYIANEVQRTEQGVLASPPAWQSPSEDPQAKELYRIADKNIAEYRAQFAGVMAGVHRAEAQCAVYMTTLDSLRMKMIGYRLVGRGPEMSSHDFLEALGEAKLQLNAIDQALDELDFTQMPKMIAAMPPPIPEELTHLQQGQ